MFWYFARKKEVTQAREDAKKGFETVKKDVSSMSGWIKHLDSEKNILYGEINLLKEGLSSIKEDIENLKNVVSLIGELKINPKLPTPKRLSKEQIGVYAVQTGVQTGVQTPKLDQFSVTERAIIWVLLNSELKLSYDDLSAMFGKERSTIRGQINSIKQKSESLLKEIVEKNGKKRVFIPEEIKTILLKKPKVRDNQKIKR